MNNEFTNQVHQLFQQVVTNGTDNNNADDLLHTLLCKVTLPLRHYWEADHLHIVYYNVSLDIARDLSSFDVFYTSEFTTTFTDLQHYDTFQLAEFVLTLERDIPQWRHVWLAAKELHQKKQKMVGRLKNALSEIRHAWMANKVISDSQHDQYRIRYYNIKAGELMLSHDNPFWTNKKTESEILDECNLYHLDAPLEQWYEDWTQFSQNCDEQRTERDRKRQEHQDKLMKMRHLINIKQLKLEALLKTIEYHPSVTVNVHNNFDFNRIDSTRYGKYTITVSIDNARTFFRICYDQLDKCTMKITEYINRINDLASELRCALIEDGSSYYIANKGHSYIETFNINTFYIAEYPGDGKREIKCDHLSSSRVINRINAICNNLRTYINHCTA